MFAIFTYLLFLFSYSYQLLIFYELNQYRLGSIKDILKIIIILVISIIILDFIIGQAIFLILVIFFYSKKSQLSKIVSTILFANLITYAADLFIRLIGLSFPIITSYFVPIAVTYYVLVYFLIKRVKLYQLFIKEKNYLLLGLIVYAFIALHIIGLISMKANQDLTGTSGLRTLSSSLPSNSKIKLQNGSSSTRTPKVDVSSLGMISVEISELIIFRRVWLKASVRNYAI